MAAEYLALVVKVESFVAQASARQAEDLQCKRGCDGCCHAWLSVGSVEAEQVRQGLSALSPSVRAEVRARGERELQRELAREEPPRCAMLGEDGSCSIYAFRPLVCRTQGHALRYPSDFIPEEAVRLRLAKGAVTWCPLNYRDHPPRPENILDAERVDQILALVTHRHDAAQGASGRRESLSALAAGL